MSISVFLFLHLKGEESRIVFRLTELQTPDPSNPTKLEGETIERAREIKRAENCVRRTIVEEPQTDAKYLHGSCLMIVGLKMTSQWILYK